MEESTLSPDLCATSRASASRELASLKQFVDFMCKACASFSVKVLLFCVG